MEDFLQVAIAGGFSNKKKENKPNKSMQFSGKFNMLISESVCELSE
jgi:hypothetical protein